MIFFKYRLVNNLEDKPWPLLDIFNKELSDAIAGPLDGTSQGSMHLIVWDRKQRHFYIISRIKRENCVL